MRRSGNDSVILETRGDRLWVREVEDVGGTPVTTTLAQNLSAGSLEGTRYRVRAVLDGLSIKVYRSDGTEPESLVIDATLDKLAAEKPTLANTGVTFACQTGEDFGVDDVMILADDLDRDTVMTYRSNNEIISATDYNGQTDYTHDAWGRTATEAKNGVTKTYAWTSANLLGAVNSSDPNDTDVAYSYTGDLKRLWRWENGSISDAYQWDAGFNVIGEARVGEPMKTYVPGLAEVNGNDLSTTADYRYLTHDHLGSTRGMWDGSIGNLGTWEFTPYGSPFNFNGPPDVTQLYTGHDLDRATGQYYAPFRYLDPAIGRWSKRDPLGMIDGTNMYAYVSNNPINYIDPFGLSDDEDEEHHYWDTALPWIIIVGCGAAGAVAAGPAGLGGAIAGGGVGLAIGALIATGVEAWKFRETTEKLSDPAKERLEEHGDLLDNLDEKLDKDDEEVKSKTEQKEKKP